MKEPNELFPAQFAVSVSSCVCAFCVCTRSVEFVPRYIKTSGNATVDHLSKYLAVRLALEELRRNAEASPVNVEAASEKQYTIYIPTAGNQFTVSHTVVVVVCLLLLTPA